MISVRSVSQTFFLFIISTRNLIPKYFPVKNQYGSFILRFLFLDFVSRKSLRSELTKVQACYGTLIKLCSFFQRNLFVFSVSYKSLKSFTR